MITIIVDIINRLLDLLPDTFSQVDAAGITFGQDALNIISWSRFFLPLETIINLLILTASWYFFKFTWSIIKTLANYFLKS